MKSILGKKMIGSLVDPVGQLFYKDNKVFRMISKDFITKSLELLESGLIDELVSEGIFPKTLIINLINEDVNSLILEHELLPVSYPHEWSPSMLKDAALLTIKVNKIALKYGYCLKDGHAWNVLFRGYSPVFVDFGSFIKKEEGLQENVQGFIEAFIVPLVLFQEGDFYLAHKLLIDSYMPISRLLLGSFSRYLQSKTKNYYLSNIKIFDVFDIVVLGRETGNIFRKITKKINHFTDKFAIKRIAHFENSIVFLEDKIRKINFKNNPNTSWTNYQNEYRSSSRTHRFNRIIEITKKLENVQSSLDVAGNHAYLSILLSNSCKFEKMYSMDYDISSIEVAYCLLKQNSININLIATNFLELTHDNSLIERVKSDVVYGLALTHHLILSQGLRIEMIFETFYNLTNSYVFIEFMPLGLWSGGEKRLDLVPSWYYLDWFRDNFLEFFELLEETELETNRILLVGKKINRY